MRPRAATWPLAALLGVLPLASAFADSLPPVPVRVGNHEGYSRVVFNLPSRTDYHVTQEGQHVVVQFAGDVLIGAANNVPRNVLTVTGGAGRAEIVVAPGTIVRDWRLGNVVVMDFMDHDAAISDKKTTQETVATQPPPENPGPGVTPSDAPSARPVQPPSTKSPVTPPAALAAQAARPPPIKPPPHITLPAAPAPQTGAPANQAAQPPPTKQPPGVTPPAAPALQAGQQPPTKPLTSITPPAAPAPQTDATPTRAVQPPPTKQLPGVTPPAAPAVLAVQPPSAEVPPAQQPGAPPLPTKLEVTNPVHEPVPVAAVAPDAAPGSTAQAAAQAAAVGDEATQSTPSFEAGLVVPSVPQLGVAVFRRGRTALIVFDQPIGIDISPPGRAWRWNRTPIQLRCGPRRKGSWSLALSPCHRRPTSRTCSGVLPV